MCLRNLLINERRLKYPLPYRSLSLEKGIAYKGTAYCLKTTSVTANQSLSQTTRKLRQKHDWENMP